MSQLSRRDLLSTLLIPALARLQPVAGGRLLASVPFTTARSAPLNRLLGTGLDARLFTDLSTLTADAPDTPNDRFFIRTAAPRRLPSPWTVGVGGLVRDRSTVDVAALRASSRPAGRVLVECAGNGDTAGYGLMSVADWEGVPLQSILERAKPTTPRYRVLVSGVDDDGPSQTSVPGASWIFSTDDLADAFLAVRMNGAEVPPDHGGPLRLIVPGWYGCACIKWVDRIELVADDAPATSQMIEYASRTHQTVPPPLARDFVPAVIDTAAMPVRVERWSVGGRIEYRIIGIVWGGTKPTNALEIRFRTGGPWTRVEHCPMPPSTRTWTLWTHTWRPESPGRYDIVLRVADRSIRTRRLDLFFYVRTVAIDEI